jgi:hypothetical protein
MVVVFQKEQKPILFHTGAKLGKNPHINKLQLKPTCYAQAE